MTEGTEQGTNTGTGEGTGSQDNLGWRAALPDEFKNHDYVKTFEKPGDFVKSALDIKTEHDSMKTKLEKAIFKPGDDAKPEEVSAFHKALGVPEKADDYEFQAAEGVEHDPKMTDWAKKTFHTANLTKDQAGIISQAWDGFMTGMVEAQKEASEKAVKEATETLKKEWGADFDKNLELTKRGWKKFADTEFDAFCDETGVGNHPALVKFIHNVGKAMGEDFSPQGSQDKGSGKHEGIVYDKSPAPPSVQ